MPYSNPTRPRAKVCVCWRARRSKHGLTLLVDITLDQVSAEGGLFRDNRHWFHPFEAAEARLDPRHAPHEESAAHANFGDGEAAQALTEWWARELMLLADAGIGGFRFEAPHKVPAHVWRRLGAAVRERHPQTKWLAWTVGISRHDLAALADAGFDSVFSSSRWWDFQGNWLFDEHAALFRIAPPIAFPEEPYGSRLLHDLPDTSDSSLVERAYRRALYTAAGIGTGLLVPMGFEYGVTQPLTYNHGSAEEFRRAKEGARFNVSAEVAHANALQRNSAALASTGELRALTGAGTPYAAILRGSGPDLRVAAEAALIVLNPGPHYAGLCRYTPSAGRRTGQLHAVSGDRRGHDGNAAAARALPAAARRSAPAARRGRASPSCSRNRRSSAAPKPPTRSR